MRYNGQADIYIIIKRMEMNQVGNSAFDKRTIMLVIGDS